MVKSKFKQLSIPWIQNVPYQPDMNPCESCLSKVKHYYKTEKLKSLVNDVIPNYTDLIDAAIEQVNEQDICNAIEYSLALIN